MSRNISIEGGFDLCYSELHESMRESEYHYMILKRQNLKLQAAIQQMQATVPGEHEANDLRVQALHKHATFVVGYTMRDTTNAVDAMRTGLHGRDSAVRRVVARIVDRLSGQRPAWGRPS